MVRLLQQIQLLWEAILQAPLRGIPEAHLRERIASYQVPSPFYNRILHVICGNEQHRLHEREETHYGKN